MCRSPGSARAHDRVVLVRQGAPPSGHETGHLHCSLPAPSPVPLHNDLHNAWGVPGPRPHSWGVADLAWPTEPWILPAPGWDPEALQKEMADVRGGLAQPLSCTPTLPLPEPSALILASGCTASSCGTLGHGPCPHLSPTLTRSRMALQTAKVCPWEGSQGHSGLCLGRPCLASGPLGPGGPYTPGIHPSPHQLLCGLFGSSPSSLALLLPPGPFHLPRFLPAGRGGCHSWFSVTSALPHWPGGCLSAEDPCWASGSSPAPSGHTTRTGDSATPQGNLSGPLPTPLCGELCPAPCGTPGMGLHLSGPPLPGL